MNSSTVERDRTYLPLGLFCILAGLGALFVARDYDTGTVISMGPGFFPKSISGGLVLLGALILLFRSRDLPEEDDIAKAPPKFTARLRIIGCVTAAILVFALTLVPLGLPLATFLMVVIAGVGHEASSPKAVLITALALAAFATVLFAWLLRLQIPIMPQVFS